MVKKPIFLISFLLSACTTDPVPDEEFEAPSTNYPLLGTVPDRPSLPQSEELTRQKKRLQVDHDQAEEQAKILTTTKV